MQVMIVRRPKTGKSIVPFWRGRRLRDNPSIKGRAHAHLGKEFTRYDHTNQEMVVIRNARVEGPREESISQAKTDFTGEETACQGVGQVGHLFLICEWGNLRRGRSVGENRHGIASWPPVGCRALEQNAWGMEEMS